MDATNGAKPAADGEGPSKSEPNCRNESIGTKNARELFVDLQETDQTPPQDKLDHAAVLARFDTLQAHQQVATVQGANDRSLRDALPPACAAS